jgi:stage III sporulation protein AD
MEILKILSIGLIGAFVFIYLKSNGSELAGLTIIATSVLLIISVLGYVVSAISFFSEMASKTGISSEVFILVIKIIAISYLADFTTSICEDMGAKSIGDKVSFASKIIIFTISSPIIFTLFDVISSLVI